MILTDNNFVIFAAMSYENYNCESTEEFEKDLSIFKYLKKLFYIYEKKDDLRERLILNHLIVLYNVFEAKSCTKMLIYRLKEYHSYLFPFLIMLGYLPKDYVNGIYDENFILKISDIHLDEHVVACLRKIKSPNMVSTS